MAKGQNLSRYQTGIVRRYYNNRAAIQVTRLQELTSDLAVAEGKKAETLWKRTENTLRTLETEPPLPGSRIDALLESRDIAALATLVGELHARR